jgi:hypothetical protein
MTRELRRDIESEHSPHVDAAVMKAEVELHQ